MKYFTYKIIINEILMKALFNNNVKINKMIIKLS